MPPTQQEGPATQFDDDLAPTLEEVAHTLEPSDHDAQEEGSGADVAAIKDLQERMCNFNAKQIEQTLEGMSEPTMERAVVAYATFNNVAMAEVNLDDLQQSEEGAAYWAFKGLDIKVASPLGQVFTRALKHMDESVKNMYLALNDSLKERFRAKYLFERKWDFVHERRMRTIEHCKADKSIGEYMNFIQLSNAFGGYQFDEAKEEATIYAQHCREYGAPMVQTDPITQKENFLKIRSILETTTKESWKAITETAVTESIWQSLAAESRAKRSFAAHAGMGAP